MAKAVFHKHQRVYVKPVGTWAEIEKVIPHWTKGLEEPLRVQYDVGLGREFDAEELVSEEAHEVGIESEAENWRVLRARNKWQAAEDCGRHPYPGTYPVIVTHEKNWGGWRVPGAEYDQDPYKIEAQAKVMASALKFMHLVRKMVDFADAQPADLPGEILQIARDGRELIDAVEKNAQDAADHVEQRAAAPEAAAQEAPAPEAPAPEAPTPEAIQPRHPVAAAAE